MGKYTISLFTVFSAVSFSFAGVKPYSIQITGNTTTGAVSSLTVQGDEKQMDWLVRTDGTQYPWVKDNLGWGLGYFTITKGHESIKKEWTKPATVSAGGMEVTYKEDDILVKVNRQLVNGELTERYTLTNEGASEVSLYDIGIYTPFNDNYPDARTCINQRTNVQVWTGENAAYVNALRMGAFAPHLGLVVMEGSVKSYEIWERGRKKANSQTRGIFALNLPDLQLRSGQSYTLSWTVFPHEGNADFKKKLLEKGGVLVDCNKYVLQKGEILKAVLSTAHPLTACEAFVNGVPVDVAYKNGKYVVEDQTKTAGEVRVDFRYNGNKWTHADCLVIDNIDTLLKKRSTFIRTHQQMNNSNDLRYGAYMVYDNEADSIYLNNTPNCNPVDRDEGAERVGMGVFLAKQYLLTKEPALKESLLKYAKFVRERLQTKDFKTFSSVDQKGRNRGYNYMWVADFDFLMYRVTGDKKYVRYGYETLQSMFRQFGYGFYAIGIPVRRGLQSLKAAGMEKEYKTLLKGFYKTGDIFIKNGVNYPAHEVNYEQSIVAPAVQFLLELYLESGKEKYLAEAKRQLPVLEAFNGFQPSFHLNEVAVRHWDGHWFGKREMFGDTFPHYWSTITAAVFHLYAEAVKDASYQERAKNIVRNNLCLFFEDGKASCAYLYPYKIDGVKGQFYDAYANDQDWALVYYLLVNKNL